MKRLTETDMLELEGEMAECKSGHFTLDFVGELSRALNVPPNIKSISGPMTRPSPPVVGCP